MQGDRREPQLEDDDHTEEREGEIQEEENDPGTSRDL
jgi:hypothetical protein